MIGDLHSVTGERSEADELVFMHQCAKEGGKNPVKKIKVCFATSITDTFRKNPNLRCTFF